MNFEQKLKGYEGLTCAELKNRLKAKRLSTSGTKDHLREKLTYSEFSDVLRESGLGVDVSEVLARANQATTPLLRYLANVSLNDEAVKMDRSLIFAFKCRCGSITIEDFIDLSRDDITYITLYISGKSSGEDWPAKSLEVLDQFCEQAHGEHLRRYLHYVICELMSADLKTGGNTRVVLKAWSSFDRQIRVKNNQVWKQRFAASSSIRHMFFREQKSTTFFAACWILKYYNRIIHVTAYARYHVILEEMLKLPVIDESAWVLLAKSTIKHPISKADFSNMSIDAYNKLQSEKFLRPLLEMGVHIEADALELLIPIDLCKREWNIEKIKALPSVPLSLIARSESLVEQPDYFDLHANRLDILRGMQIQDNHLSKLDRNQAKFSRLVPLMNSAFVFRGVRVPSQVNLNLDLDTVTFATWNVEKALLYASKRSTTVFQTDELTSFLMVIRCYEGMPVIRTRFSDELVLPRNTQLYQTPNTKICTIHFEQMNPLYLVFYDLVPTRRKRYRN